MIKQITKQLDHEKGKARDRARNPEYQERFREEGQNFDRGGTSVPKIVSFRGSIAYLDKRPFYMDDKQSLIRTLEAIKFLVAGQLNTISKLLKNPAVAAEAADRFERTKLSILRADQITSTATHPKTGRQFPVIPFKCFLQPADPLPEPIFKKCLAFSAVFPSPDRAK